MFIRGKAARLILSLFVIPKSFWISFKSETGHVDALCPPLLGGQKTISGEKKKKMKKKNHAELKEIIKLFYR